MKHPILTLLVLFSLLAVHATEPAAAEAADTNTGPTQQPSSGAATKTGSAVAVSGPRVREVIVVFKTHFDIGYTDMARNVVQTCRTTMIDQALAVVDQNRDLPASQQFVWTIPGWPMHRILDWPEQTPERRHRVLQAFKDGRFVVHALPFTMHMETLELEDLVRGFGFSTKVSAAAGLPLPRDAKMTDVPEHTWTTATILSHAGVKFMHIGCNPMSGAPQVPPLFWWQGPDGSRVLTMYSPHYGTGLFPPDDWPHRTWLALEHTYDNLGPPKPEEVKKILQQYADKMPGVKVRIGRLSDFGEAILAEKPDLPVVRADSPDTWIHGPMSDPAGMKIARNIRPLIAATECLNTELRAWNQPVADASASIAAAYEKSLMYGEHTWGGSIAWLDSKFGFGDSFWQERASGRYKRIEESWDEHTAYIEQARYPLLAAAADTTAIPPHPLPPTREGLSVSRRGVLVTAFGADPSNAGTLLRLWELAGASGEVLVRLPEGMHATRAMPVNLRGEAAGEQIPVKEGVFRFDLKAFAPASFVLAMNREGDGR